MRHLGHIVRILLMLCLLVPVYLETGWATTLILFLIAARFEVQDYNEKRTF